MATEWATAKLGDVCDLFDAPHQTAPLSPDGPVVYLNVGDIHKGRVELRLSGRVSEDAARAWSGRVSPRAGDVVFGYEATVGEAALLTSDHRWCLGRRVGLLRPRLDLIDPRFLVYSWYTPRFQETLRANRVGGTTIESIRLTDLPTWTIQLPNLDEQHRIAGILGALDDKIELNRRTSETLETIARALFKSWFVDFEPIRAKAEGRDPGLPANVAGLFPDSFVDSELGEIPERWGTGSIYEIADVIYGAPFSSTRFNTQRVGRPLIRIRDLVYQRPTVWTTEELARGCVVRAGDIVVGMDGEFRAQLWHGPDAWLNQRVCLFKPKLGWPAAFVRGAIAAPLAEVEATETATTVIHLGKADVDRFRVVVPPAGIVAAFGAITDPLYRRIVGARQEAAVLASIRDALLPRLLSGDPSVTTRGAP